MRKKELPRVIYQYVETLDGQEKLDRAFDILFETVMERRMARSSPLRSDKEAQEPTAS